MKKLPKLKLGNPILVLWNDTVSCECSWFSPQELSEVSVDRGLMATLGFYMETKDGYLYLAHSRDMECDLYSAICKIPIGTIEKVTKI